MEVSQCCSLLQGSCHYEFVCVWVPSWVHSAHSSFLQVVYTRTQTPNMVSSWATSTCAMQHKTSWCHQASCCARTWCHQASCHADIHIRYTVSKDTSGLCTCFYIDLFSVLDCSLHVIACAWELWIYMRLCCTCLLQSARGGLQVSRDLYDRREHDNNLRYAPFCAPLPRHNIHAQSLHAKHPN